MVKRFYSVPTWGAEAGHVERDSEGGKGLVGGIDLGFESRGIDMAGRGVVGGKEGEVDGGL